jgi:dienelactone hydrolase
MTFLHRGSVARAAEASVSGGRLASATRWQRIRRRPPRRSRPPALVRHGLSPNRRARALPASSPRRRVRLLALSTVPLVAGALVLAACGTSSERDSTHRSSKRGERVVFEAADGVRLTGMLFGGGLVGVIFVHMGRGGDTQADFYTLARALAGRGYLALTYNRRGVCGASGRQCSQGADDYASSWKDVVGAVEYLRSRGAASVVLIGASIGAMASLYAAASHRVEPAALIEIGGVNHASSYDFTRQQLQGVAGAKLFVSSADDVYGGADAAREWYSWATEPRQLAILPGAAHGTDMLPSGEPTARPLVRLVLRFLARSAPPHEQPRR